MAIVNAATSNITRAGNRQSNIRVQLPTTPLPQQQSGVVVKAVKAEGHAGPPSSVVVVAHPGHHPSAAAATGQPSVVRLPMRPTGHAPIIVSGPSPSQQPVVPTSLTSGGGLLLQSVNLPTTPLQIPGNSREAVTTTVSSSQVYIDLLLSFVSLGTLTAPP